MQVTFGLNVSPVLLSVLDQMAKEVEDILAILVGGDCGKSEKI